VIDPDQLTASQWAALQFARDGLTRDGSIYRVSSGPIEGTFQRRTINALQRYGLVEVTDHARTVALTPAGVALLSAACTTQARNAA
jgi:hypothetical protein